MKKLISPHLLPFALCLWFLFSYVLQPFPANIIATLVIAALAGVSFRNPSRGAVAAVFLTPLTLSLGRHLEAILGEWAPPYQPYAEIVLLSVLWGWILRAMRERYRGDSPADIRTAIQSKTPAEKLLLAIMTLWAGLAVVGVFPALYRNLLTSPPIPPKLVAIKVAFAPVWGWADEFFPITMALRILLAWCFVFYAQQLVERRETVRRIAYAFCSAMAVAIVYAVLQSIFDFGYSKARNPAYYVQSTFHENESFGSFCLVALVMVFVYAMIREARNGDTARTRLIREAGLWLLGGLFVLGVLISGSRAMMILGLLMIPAFFWVFWMKRRETGVSLRVYKRQIVGAAVLLCLLVPVAFVLGGRVNRIEKIGNEFESVFSGDFRELKTSSSRRDLNLYARIQLWAGGIDMMLDSRGAGMGTGSYFALTGFPRYDALLGRKENAHFTWLQVMSELGVLSVPVALGFLLLPLWLWWSRLFQNDAGRAQLNNNLGPASRRALLLLLSGVVSLWFCNVIGQSLLQQEILWLFALLIGVAIVGGLPRSFVSLWRSHSARKFILTVFCFLVVGQLSLWASTANQTDLLGLPNDISETYGYAFDEDGHRYLKVGRVYQEKIVAPSSGGILEFRVRPAGQQVSETNPLNVKVYLADAEGRVVASESVQFTSSDKIRSVSVSLDRVDTDFVTAMLRVDEVVLTGNPFISKERQLLGLRYYGYRLNADCL